MLVLPYLVAYLDRDADVMQSLLLLIVVSGNVCGQVAVSQSTLDAPMFVQAVTEGYAYSDGTVMLHSVIASGAGEGTRTYGCRVGRIIVVRY